MRPVVLKMSPSNDHKKSISVGFIAAIVLGAGVTMILLNYWHAMKCVESKGLGDMNDYVEVLEKRILQLESNVYTILFHINKSSFVY